MDPERLAVILNRGFNMPCPVCLRDEDTLEWRVQRLPLTDILEVVARCQRCLRQVFLQLKMREWMRDASFSQETISMLERAREDVRRCLQEFAHDARQHYWQPRQRDVGSEYSGIWWYPACSWGDVPAGRKTTCLPLRPFPFDIDTMECLPCLQALAVDLDAKLETVQAQR